MGLLLCEFSLGGLGVGLLGLPGGGRLSGGEGEKEESSMKIPLMIPLREFEIS